MRYEFCTFGGDRSIMKGTLLEEQRTSCLYRGFHSSDFYVISYISLSTHALHKMYVWLCSVNNERQFTIKATYLLIHIATYFRGIFLKLYTWHWPRMPYIRCRCLCNRSIIKGTCVEEQSTFPLYPGIYSTDFPENSNLALCTSALHSI